MVVMILKFNSQASSTFLRYFILQKPSDVSLNADLRQRYFFVINFNSAAIWHIVILSLQKNRDYVSSHKKKMHEM